MEDSNNIENLLNELNALQMQFNNLQPISTSSKVKEAKKDMKTKLTSNVIDNEFFSTITAPLKKEKINNSKDQNTLFTLDKTSITKATKKDKVETLSDTINNETHIDLGILNNVKETSLKEEEKKKEVKKNTFTKNSNIKSELELKKERINNNFDNLQNKITNELNNDSKNKTTSSESYLSIKQKLDKIKSDIALREKIIEKESVKVEKLKIYSKIESSNKVTIEEQTTKSKVKNVLSPVNKTKNKTTSNKEVKKEIKNALSPVMNNETIQKKKKVRPLVAEINTKETPNPKKSVNFLTIIIVVLVFILIAATWYLLN